MADLLRPYPAAALGGGEKHSISPRRIRDHRRLRRRPQRARCYLIRRRRGRGGGDLWAVRPWRRRLAADPGDRRTLGLQGLNGKNMLMEGLSRKTFPAKLIVHERFFSCSASIWAANS
jgi:hypothetical protein